MLVFSVRHGCAFFFNLTYGAASKGVGRGGRLGGCKPACQVAGSWNKWEGSAQGGEETVYAAKARCLARRVAPLPPARPCTHRADPQARSKKDNPWVEEKGLQRHRAAQRVFFRLDDTKKTSLVA
jgi:hypothetical protein